MRRWRMVLLVALITTTLTIFGRPPGQARAVDPLCFDVPGINNCISETFRTFWEAGGGLAAFGYPLTAPTYEVTPEGAFLVQYFERARFESHPELPFYSQVLLGRLGAELYADRPARENPQIDCQYFSETGYNVCDPFLTKWQSAPGTPGLGSLDLYGLPISPRILSQDAQGNPISIQWFERARFELHGGNLILLGHIGREFLDRENNPPPQPVPLPTPEPAPLPPTPEPPAPTPAFPPPIEAPFPARPCHINVPAPIEGIQAWPTLPEVGPPYDEVICVRLIVNGEPAHPAFVNIYRHNPGGDVIPGIGHTTGFDGTTGFIFYVGDLPLGATVPVEAVATFEGREYRVWTSFIRR
ncbi:MAG TPA: hypothetical protein VD886_25105 [Herpetosiphonaceae bacterium]|nr:hypothetical protein [Herpetosiphonaceae bacterium]